MKITEVAIKDCVRAYYVLISCLPLEMIAGVSGRDFSMSGEIPIPQRRIDNDAPHQMRTELLNSVFALADNAVGPSERTLYNAITGALGIVAAVQPYGGLPRRASEHLNQVDWPRVYDIILRLVSEFTRAGRLAEYRNSVNTTLAAHGIVWDLSEDGRLVRVLPVEAAGQVAATVRDLDDAQFQAARQLLAAAQDAFNAIPRRDRDACANVFDAMESVGRTRFGGATFGDVLGNLRRRGGIDRFTVGSLQSLEILRHNHFGHGGEVAFGLSAAEVDFVYITCIASISLLTRI